MTGGINLGTNNMYGSGFIHGFKIPILNDNIVNIANTLNNLINYMNTSMFATAGGGVILADAGTIPGSD